MYRQWGAACSGQGCVGLSLFYCKSAIAIIAIAAMVAICSCDEGKGRQVCWGDDGTMSRWLSKCQSLRNHSKAVGKCTQTCFLQLSPNVVFPLASLPDCQDLQLPL